MVSNDYLKSHPISFVENLRDKFGSDLILGFSRYKYSPRLRRDERERFKVPIKEITPNWLKHQLLLLQPAQELALESKVTLDGRTRHIPMLDFRGMTKGQLSAIMEVFPKEYTEGVYVYLSGRSYHAYFMHLLSTSQWVRFMGSSLLCNTPNDPSVVDQRWIGHRLIGGYAALRWSCNTAHYKSYPRRIDTAELDSTFAEKRSITDRALNSIEGVPNKSTYYEELVESALRDIEIKFKRHVTRKVADKVFIVDFVVELDNARLVGIEVVYSDHRYLTKERIASLRDEAASIIKKGGLTNLVVITNTEVRDTDKKLFANNMPPLDFIESTVSPDGLLSRLEQYLKELRSSR